jgi:IgGFc binding protein
MRDGPWPPRATLLLLLTMVGCGPDGAGGSDDGGAPDGHAGCRDGDTRCDGDRFEICRGGSFEATDTCADACEKRLGCVRCLPGSGDTSGDGGELCAGEVARVCAADGQGYVDEPCDPRLGLTCSPISGLCEGACSRQSLGASYIGCDYYPTITGNIVLDDFAFAVVIASASDEPAEIRIEGGGLDAPRERTVAPGGVAIERLPWHPELKLCTSAPEDPSQQQTECVHRPLAGTLVRGGAYHLRSTRPITVYQFNALDYLHPDADLLSYTNDASLLLPTNALRGRYVVASFPAQRALLYPLPGELAVTATADGTTVKITSRAPTQSRGELPGFSPGIQRSIQLDAGDVAQLTAAEGDLTGTLVEADRPVQVVGGHYCTTMPTGRGACDHLEEAMFPAETLGRDYLVTSPVDLDPNGVVSDNAMPTMRIVATQPETTLTFDPPLPETERYLEHAGDFAEARLLADDVRVTADKPVLVAQYMEATHRYPWGDPSLSLAVPVQQYRRDYLFHAPANYLANYVNVTARSGARILIDGVEVSGWRPIGAGGSGGSGHAVARVELSAGTGGGNHVATGDVPFGISVYGFGLSTSYWYPGGLALEVVE